MKWKTGMMMVAMAALTMACGGTGENTEDSKRQPQSKEARKAEIAEMEANLKSSGKMDQGVNKAKADALVKRYRDYINMNPHDTASADYLFKAADLSVGLGDYESAIRYLDRITTDFTWYDRIVEIWLFKGFVYEAHMNKHGEAVATYRKLIEKYPNHRLAKDAQAAIDNMTMSEEELLEKLQKASEKKAS